MKKVVIAPDSFKGTLTSQQVCEVISQVLERNYPDTQIIALPVADGGEGTADALQYALGGEKVYCKALSPLGRELDAYFLDVDGKFAVIESAVASGITLEKNKDALRATSFGTGQLIKTALDKGISEIVIGIGGSAMTDAGAGCLEALGVRFYDEKGDAVKPCGGNLCRIKSLDLTEFDERISKTKITLLCDVRNPLYGERGAAYIFAPQKGATEKEVQLLDEGLREFAKLCKAALGEDFSFREGAGAAGGLGFALMAFMKAEVRSGIDCVLELCGFSDKVKNADAVITGEGKLDSQSLLGKVPFGVTSICRGKRVIAVVGVSELTAEAGKEMGIEEIIETNPQHLPFDEIKHCAKAMLYEAAEKIKL